MIGQTAQTAHTLLTEAVAQALEQGVIARPGRIVASYEIPFDYPRTPELRFDPEFAKLSGEVSLSLRGAHL